MSIWPTIIIGKKMKKVLRNYPPPQSPTRGARPRPAFVVSRPAVYFIPCARWRGRGRGAGDSTRCQGRSVANAGRHAQPWRRRTKGSAVAADKRLRGRPVRGKQTCRKHLFLPVRAPPSHCPAARNNNPRENDSGRPRPRRTGPSVF